MNVRESADRTPISQALKLTATAISHHTLSRSWYNAALFCLRQAEFMQTPSVRSVQAIAVLGICCNNFGESESGSYLWSCAILIAKTIGLDSPVSKVAIEQLSEEAQHRLWWTLVICDWYDRYLTFVSMLFFHDPVLSHAMFQFDLDLGYDIPIARHPSTTSISTFLIPDLRPFRRLLNPRKPKSIPYTTTYSWPERQRSTIAFVERCDLESFHLKV